MSTSLFTVNKWQENFVFEKKIAHARASYTMTGELVGSAEVDYSIYYLHYDEEDIHASTSRFEGFAVFKGEINGKKGSFAYYDCGSFINNQYQASIEILAGTGTEDFKGVQGKGTYHPTDKGMELNLELI